MIRPFSHNAGNDGHDAQVLVSAPQSGTAVTPFTAVKSNRVGSLGGLWEKMFLHFQLRCVHTLRARAKGGIRHG